MTYTGGGFFICKSGELSFGLYKLGEFFSLCVEKAFARNEIFIRNFSVNCTCEEFKFLMPTLVNIRFLKPKILRRVRLPPTVFPRNVRECSVFGL